MNHCPKCNFPLEAQLAVCPQCGAELAQAESGPGTAGQGTVSAPGVEPGAKTVAAGEAPVDDELDRDDAETTHAALDHTLLAGMTELDEADDFDFDDSLPGVRSDAGDEHTIIADDAAGRGRMGTVLAGDDSSATHIPADQDPRATIPAADTSPDAQATHIGGGTVDASQSTAGDERATHAVDQPPASSNDAAGTVVLPGNAPSTPPGEKTVVFDSQATGGSTVQASGNSGTEGRLKRLWEGVAGSSANPMHSLQAVGLQASDSVFQREATRRVADAGATENFSADYQIVDKLGEGAMGIVFSARQTAVNRVVAIKTAKPNFQNNDESRRRFLYEAHITADLDHSNIIPIHELGASEEGMLFYSMKLVQGTEWSRVMRKKSREQNLEIFMKVTDAIAFAHSKGVIHRDLKPENTMLGRFGEVFVTDWGTAVNLDKDTTHLAKPASKGDKFLTLEDASNFVRGDSLVLHDGYDTYDRVQIVNFDEANPNRIYLRRKLTRDYQPSRRLFVVKGITLAGTPCYMAPEMAGHQLPKIGKTSDIYILGAILYDLATGRPPHTGDSVTQCLRAALQNEILPADSDDALLTIALKAMATEPAQRYQSVEELQQAVREYRQHAESITLAERSDELLAQATQRNDYETFSRALFGYRDAIDLWPDNTAAVSGLKKARLAFGTAAYSKGDYDLVLQTLDPNDSDEAALYSQAAKAKRKAAEREKSLTLLKRVVAAVVLFAIVGLSTLAWIANNQKNLAVAAKTEAEEAATKETAARKDAEIARQAADASRIVAEEKTKVALAQTEIANEATKKAEVSAEVARNAAAAERVAADAARRSAIAEKKASDLAKRQADLAKRRAAQIMLGESKSLLGLAKSQIESFDMAAGAENLSRLAAMFGAQLPAAGALQAATAAALPAATTTTPVAPTTDSTNAVGEDTLAAEDTGTAADVFFGNVPKIDTWGWRRIQLLGNLDLPTASLPKDLLGAGNDARRAQVTAVAVAPAARLAVVGTQHGGLQILHYENGDLQLGGQFQEPEASITALAISPDGQEVVFGFTRGESGGVKRWDVSQNSAQDVVATGKRNFQRFAYTPDGQHIIGGISGGLWLWQRSDQWYSQPDPTARVNIRGELTHLQPVSAERSLLTTRFVESGQPKVLLGMLDHATREIRFIETTEQVAQRLHSAAHTLVDDQIVLGLNDNRLLVGTLAQDANQITGLVELESMHRAPVTEIITNGSKQLVTASDSEPVAHVWRFNDSLATWEHDTYLTGTPRNVAGLGALAEGQVLGVDAAGTAIVWDVERQKQRRRLERHNEQQTADYVTPVQSVVAGPSHGRAIAIDAEGVVDLWNLTNGQTTRVDGQRWSYFGHTPGAELVNSAIDVQRGVVVTAASLQSARKAYLPDAAHAWEFCVWNLRNGEMLKRWSVPHRRVDMRQETIEQRISLVDRGRQLLFASDSETRIMDLDSGRETLIGDDFGSYFAVPNPQSPSLLMLVKRSGAVRMVDLEQLDSWHNPAYRNYGLADPSDIPLAGVWSEDGQRFYLTFSTGGLAAFGWNGEQLELAWSSRAQSSTPQTQELLTALHGTGGRVSSHLDVDLGIVSGDVGDTLYIATRKRGATPTTKLVSLQFSAGAPQPQLVQAIREPQIAWLQLQANQPPRLAERIHDVLIVDASRVRSRIKLDNQIFVSTVGGQVLEMTAGDQRVTSYGRARLLSASGTRDGKSLFTLMEDGSLWKFTLDDAGGQWSRLEHTALGASEIQVSPEGQQLLLIEQGQAQVVETDTGRQVADLGRVAAATWDVAQAGRLAIARPDGELLVGPADQLQPLAERPLLADGGELVSLNFFRETWADAQQPVRQFLLVHSQNAQQGQLQFVPIDPAPANAADDQAEVEIIPAGSRVAVSPTENVLVTGSPGGTVAVWFAAPTHDRRPHQLFDLEGHRGEDITCLTFSSDGQTIITADSKSRLFAWLSSDPMMQPN